MIDLSSAHGVDAATLMKMLCDIGPRPAAGQACRQARALIGELLSDLGAACVREEEVPVRLWNPGFPKLELTSPYGSSIPCLQCLYTAAGDISAPLVIEESECLDAVVLLRGHSISGGKYVPLPSRIEEKRLEGAKAVIACSTDPTGLPAIEVIGLRGGHSCSIPCVSISSDAGERLEDAVRAGRAFVRIHTDGFEEPGLCANLIADLGPDTRPKETIILGAHLDSFYNVPGVLDNLTGVVTILEIARLLAPQKSKFRRTLRIIAYTGEEIGFLGSKAYVAAHADELDNIRFVINMDCIFPSTARGMAVMFSPEMRDYISRAFDDAGCRVDVRDMFCMSSDYLAFMLQGIPAARPADFESMFPIWSHTELDDLEHIDVGWVRENAQAYASLLVRMLTDPEPLPAVRLTPDYVRQRLDQEGVVSDLQASGFDI